MIHILIPCVSKVKSLIYVTQLIQPLGLSNLHEIVQLAPLRLLSFSFFNLGLGFLLSLLLLQSTCLEKKKIKIKRATFRRVLSINFRRFLFPRNKSEIISPIVSIALCGISLNDLVSLLSTMYLVRRLGEVLVVHIDIQSICLTNSAGKNCRLKYSIHCIV